jgi:hypothetical protein
MAQSVNSLSLEDETRLFEAMLRHYVAHGSSKKSRENIINKMRSCPEALIMGRRNQAEARLETARAQRQKGRQKNSEALIALYDVVLQPTTDPAHALELIDASSTANHLRAENSRLQRKLREIAVPPAPMVNIPPSVSTVEITPEVSTQETSEKSASDHPLKPISAFSPIPKLSTRRIVSQADNGKEHGEPDPKEIPVSVNDEIVPQKSQRESSKQRRQQYPRINRDGYDYARRRDTTYRIERDSTTFRPRNMDGNRSPRRRDEHRSRSPLVGNSWCRRRLAQPTTTNFCCPRCRADMEITIGSRRRH